MIKFLKVILLNSIILSVYFIQIATASEIEAPKTITIMNKTNYILEPFYFAS